MRGVCILYEYKLVLNMRVLVVRVQPLVEQLARVVVLPAQMRVLSTFLPALVAKANLPDAVIPIRLLSRLF